MSTIDTEVKDIHGDILTVKTDEGGFELLDTYSIGDFYFNEDQARELRALLNEWLGEEYSQATSTPNEAKLAVAVQWSLKVKFAYQGELDRKPVERRLVPDTLTDTHVAGESFDAGGQSEGYRQFRLDRISGEVVVR